MGGPPGLGRLLRGLSRDLERGLQEVGGDTGGCGDCVGLWGDGGVGGRDLGGWGNMGTLWGAGGMGVFGDTGGVLGGFGDTGGDTGGWGDLGEMGGTLGVGGYRG